MLQEEREEKERVEEVGRLFVITLKVNIFILCSINSVDEIIITSGGRIVYSVIEITCSQL